MTRDNLYALCVIAHENGLTHQDGVFVTADGARYVPTPLGLVPSVNHNYRVLYDRVKGTADRVTLLKEQVEQLRSELLSKGSRKAILKQLDRLPPEEAVKWITKYLTS